MDFVSQGSSVTMSASGNSFVSVQNICFKRQSNVIYHDLSLEVPRGKIIGFMGPSGTGKTTLLQLIGGQLTPEQGKILVDGNAIHDLKTAELYALRRKMSILFQSAALFTSMTVFDNIAFPLREHTLLPESMIRDLVLIKLEMVGLRGTEKLMPQELSGGMARRIALARSLALDPVLMMYDEPFTGQDPINKAILVKLIREINDALNLTSIVVSHDVTELASIADYLYLVAEGHLLCHGTPEEVMDHSDPHVKQFVDGLADGAVPFQYPSRDYKEDLFDV